LLTQLDHLRALRTSSTDAPRHADADVNDGPAH